MFTVFFHLTYTVLILNARVILFIPILLFLGRFFYFEINIYFLPLLNDSFIFLLRFFTLTLLCVFNNIHYFFEFFFSHMLCLGKIFECTLYYQKVFYDLHSKVKTFVLHDNRLLWGTHFPDVTLAFFFS